MGRAEVEYRVETLPYRWYVDPAVAAAERNCIFRRSWQYAGHAGELDGPGSFFPTHAGGFPLLVALDREGGLRAFLNVCRHRGTILVDAPQTRGTIQCPYHAWTYGLDGALRGAPRSDEEPGFRTEELGSCRRRSTGGGRSCSRIRIRRRPHSRRPSATSRRSWPRTGDVDRLRFHHRVRYEIVANWKIALENYLECYHCRLNHPHLVRLIDDDVQRQESAGLRLSQFPPLRSGAGAAAPYDLSDGVPTAQYHLLFPAMKMNVNPGRPNLSIGPVWPLASDRTGAWFDYFFAEGTDEDWIETMVAFDARVGAEDVALVEAVQRGAGSGALSHGRLLPRTKFLIGAFQELVRERVDSAV